MLKTSIYIEKLEQLKAELSNSNFNLDSWKLKTKNIIRSIFGENDLKLEQLEQLHYDYSSWALRDSSGGKNIDKVHETAIAIIDSAIFELTIAADETKDIVEQALNNENSKNLLDILSQKEINESELKTLLQKLEESQKVDLLQALLKRC